MAFIKKHWLAITLIILFFTPVPTAHGPDRALFALVKTVANLVVSAVQAVGHSLQDATTGFASGTPAAPSYGTPGAPSGAPLVPPGNVDSLDYQRSKMGPGVSQPMMIDIDGSGTKTKVVYLISKADGNRVRLSPDKDPDEIMAPPTGSTWKRLECNPPHPKGFTYIIAEVP
jgi:hypothetical protein